MENKIKVKSFKIPKLAGHDKYAEVKVFVADGLISNGHWLFQVAWLKSLTSNTGKRLAAYAITRQMEVVKERLLGNDFGSRPLAAFVESIDLATYSKVELAQCRNFLGFGSNGKKAESLTKRVVGLEFYSQATEEFVRFDLAYFAAFKFDKSAEIFVKGPKDPSVIKCQGQIVGLVMPKIFKGE